MAELIMMSITIIAVGAMNILCFMIGAKVGQSVSKGETVELPSLDPMKAAREHREQREAKREQDKLDTALRNMDNYDGTGRGQEDIPQ
jgi:hypothetical protein